MTKRRKIKIKKLYSRRTARAERRTAKEVFKKMKIPVGFVETCDVAYITEEDGTTVATSIFNKTAKQVYE